MGAASDMVPSRVGDFGVSLYESTLPIWHAFDTAMGAQEDLEMGVEFTSSLRNF